MFGSCAIVVASLLTGCSTGALPGGSPAEPGGTAAPSQPAGKAAAPPVDDLTAVPKDCPKASEVSALAGFPVADPSPTNSSAGLACTYADAQLVNDMQINFHSAPPGTTAATVKAELESGSSGEDNITPISRFGQAAYTASPAGGGSVILVWNKGVEFSVVDAKDLDSVERVALGILAG
jgi:hypothetical protein